MSLKKTLFDTAAMSSINVFRLLAQFIAIPILSRILSPADYGVVGMAMPFVLFAIMIADAGIGVSLVRTPASERGEWATCFWLSLMLGAGLGLIMLAIAPLAASLFGEPRLGPIVMTLALVVVIQSIGAIPGSALQQNHQFRTIAVVEMIAVSGGIAAALIVAKSGGGAWALVIQQLVFFSIRVCLTVWFSPFRPKRMFDLNCVREHLIFGRNVLAANIAGFFSRSIDNLIIGKLLDAAAVGVYAMALQFARLPAMLVSGPLAYVLYAKLARVKDDKHAIRMTFLVLTRLLSTLIFPAMGMIAVAYEPIFTLLLSEKWAASGRIFRLVAAGTSVQAITILCNTVMLVLGKSHIQLRTTLEFGIGWVVALLISVLFGIEWSALAYSIVVLFYTPRLLMLMLPLIECPYWVYLRAIMVSVGVTFTIICLYILSCHIFGPGLVVQLLISSALAVAGIAASGLLQRRHFIEELKRLKANSAM